MNKNFKIGIVVVAAVVVGGGVWLLHGQTTQDQESAIISKTQVVTATAPVEAIKGKVATLSLTNHETGLAQVTIPGVDNKPSPVAQGATTQIKVTPTTPGTYPIIEEVSEPNTASIDGGTVPVEYEVGHIVVGN